MAAGMSTDHFPQINNPLWPGFKVKLPVSLVHLPHTWGQLSQAQPRTPPTTLFQDLHVSGGVKIFKKNGPEEKRCSLLLDATIQRNAQCRFVGHKGIKASKMVSFGVDCLQRRKSDPRTIGSYSHALQELLTGLCQRGLHPPTLTRHHCSMGCSRTGPMNSPQRPAVDAL